MRSEQRPLIVDEGALQGRVHLGAETLRCSVVVWAAGVRAQPLTATLGVPLDKSGRVFVEQDLSIAGHPDAFVIGDAARLDGPDGQPLPLVITDPPGGSTAENTFSL